MSAHHTAALLHTFTRAELTEALSAAGARDVAEGLYSRPDHEAGKPALALDFDDPGDVGVLIAVVTGLLGPAVGAVFGAALELGTPDHPDRSICAPRGAWFRGFALAEPTRDQWADEISDCALCQADDSVHDVPDCLTHARAPWEPQLLGVS